MTRICEKFIEEITSGSDTVSAELTQHLASCSACHEAFESLRQLKDARKSLTGKEAAAIAGILKAISAGTVASTVTASSHTASSSSLAVKSLVVAACVLSIVVAMFVHDCAPAPKTDVPVSVAENATAPQIATEPIVRIDETGDLTDNEKVASAAVNVIDSDQQSEDAENASASLDVGVQEGNKTGEAQTIFVPPDQENIESR
ncbi:MAG: hypothetical protein KKB51_13345 [Candidatus Riflebacteria bacterium]|nr:hypothetical protein [Candidatus Riflebacteria bacterium]